MPMKRFSFEQIMNHLRGADVRLAADLTALAFTLVLTPSQLSAAERLMLESLLDRRGGDNVTLPDCKPSSLKLELT